MQAQEASAGCKRRRRSSKLEGMMQASKQGRQVQEATQASLLTQKSHTKCCLNNSYACNANAEQGIVEQTRHGTFLHAGANGFAR